MKKIFYLLLMILVAGCNPGKKEKISSPDSQFISDAEVTSVTDSLQKRFPAADRELIEKGVHHAASLWRSGDGSITDFSAFVMEQYIADTKERKEVFLRISNYLESLSGNNNEITLDLRKRLDESGGEISETDRMFGNYSPGAHISEDFYNNKIAFVIALNFPYYTLAEKEKLGPSWSRDDWAMARLGDYFISRVPAEIGQAVAEATGNAEMYIAEYNIHMGHLRTDDGKQLFPANMVLLSHWNLRDELKADYADKENGAAKQEMIYKVMERIIHQEIPKEVINSPAFEWAPFSNKVTKNGTEVTAEREPDTRYQHIINNFSTRRAEDPYNPEMNTAIMRKFSLEMEISQEEVEALFDSYLSSPQLAKLGALISKRLGRELRPYDIWYDGFKAGSSIPEDLLTAKTMKLYPDPAAFRKGLPEMLVKLGWSKERAGYITSKIVVDPARGSGHAWGASMKGAMAHLRTRIAPEGMDYKGYNIAVHEFGHNVEQTISLYDVDNYMMSGVPNTAFTEANAFIFQSRNLQLLGFSDDSPEKEKMTTLDASWQLMEIMGVGMVDMKMWKWLYANPEASAAQLKDATINIATEVWNQYFAPVLGIRDSPVLAIYSHMVDTPLYLAAYSYGHVIQFQLEDYLKGRNLSAEVDRWFTQGRLTPQQWMKGAVGSEISAKPIINALDKAL